MDARELAIRSAINSVQMADPSRAQQQRDPLMPPGNHEGLVVEVHPDIALPEGGREYNRRVFLRTVILTSDNPKIPESGLVVLTMFDLARIPRFAKQASDADRFALCIQRLTDCNASQLGEITEQILLKPQDQMLRGMSFSCRASFGKAKPGISYREVAYGAQEYTEVIGEKTQTKQRWVDVDWSLGEEQSPEQLAGARAWLDENFPIRQRDLQEQKQVARTAAASGAEASQAPRRGSLMGRFGQAK